MLEAGRHVGGYIHNDFSLYPLNWGLHTDIVVCFATFWLH